MPYTPVPVGNQFIRNFPVPLDRDFVFTSTSARNSYLTDSATSGIAYTGMIVADLEQNKAYLLDTNRQWVQVGQNLNEVFGANNSGILIKTGNNTFTTGGLNAGTNIGITNPSGILGNPVISVNTSMTGINSISGVNNFSISSASGININAGSGIVNVDDLSVSGTLYIGGGIDITVAASILAQGPITYSGNPTIFDGNVRFVNTPTVGPSGSSIPVSLSGHSHTYSDITNFCSGVASCVDTALTASSGIQLVFNSGTNTLRVALSGESLAQHLLSTTGFIARSGTETYVTRSVVNGSNIQVTNGDGLAGNPTIALVSAVSGLTSLTIDNLQLDGNTISSTNSNGNIDITPAGTGAVNISKVDINSGAIDGTTIGAASAAAGTFTQVNVDAIKIDNDIIYYNNVANIDFTANEIAINNSGNNIDFRVEGDNVTNLLFVDASADRIGVGTSTPGHTLDVSGSGNFSGNLIVGGNLTVNGTTVTANVSTMELEDPIIVLGLASGNIVTDSNHDRGLALVRNSTTTAFMGWDSSASEFIVLSSGVTADSGNTYTAGTYGSFKAGLVESTGLIKGRTLESTVPSGTSPLSIVSPTLVSNLNSDLLDDNHGSYYLDWNNFSNIPDPLVTVTVSGDVAGTGTYTWTNLSGNLSVGINTTIQPNSVALGTDTTGNYVASISTSNGITGGATASEGTAISLSLDINGLTGESALADADTFAFYDASVAAHRKATADNVRDYVLGGVSGDITINSDGIASIAPGSVSLGTDTDGNYVESVAVSGSGLSLGGVITEAASFTIISNATPANVSGTIVSRDNSGNFSANIITASLSGTATNALNIEVDTSSSNTNHLIFVNGTDGNLKPSVNSNLRFNAVNNILIGDDATTPTTKIEYFILDGGTP